MLDIRGPEDSHLTACQDRGAPLGPAEYNHWQAARRMGAADPNIPRVQPCPRSVEQAAAAGGTSLPDLAKALRVLQPLTPGGGRAAVLLIIAQLPPALARWMLAAVQPLLEQREEQSGGSPDDFPLNVSHELAATGGAPELLRGAGQVLAAYAKPCMLADVVRVAGPFSVLEVTET